MASNEFNTNQQFMRTTGLQIDDIAWMQGRTQTVTYSSKFGSLNFNGSALDYTFQVIHQFRMGELYLLLRQEY